MGRRRAATDVRPDQFRLRPSGATRQLDLQDCGELGDYLQPRIAGALLQLAQIDAVDGRRVRGATQSGSGSRFLARCQPQARQEKLAVLLVAEMHRAGIIAPEIERSRATISLASPSRPIWA